jgi:predicted DNA-binding protein (MmcQ/YjbR family)
MVGYSFEEIEEYLLAKPNSFKDHPFGPEVAVYKVKLKGGEESKMYALIAEGKDPVRLSLKCDPALAELLREKYETVMSGYHLNKQHWNTIVCSGQLSLDELKELMDLSYRLVSE